MAENGERFRALEKIASLWVCLNEDGKRMVLAQIELVSGCQKYQKTGDWQREELKRAIKGKFGTGTKLAESLGWSKQKLSRILCGKQEPTIEEVIDLSKVLEVPLEEVIPFFLNKGMQKSQNAGGAA